MDNIELLSRIPFFQELDKEDLINLSGKIELKVCGINEIIFNEARQEKFKKNISEFAKPLAAKIIAERAINFAGII